MPDRFPVDVPPASGKLQPDLMSQSKASSPDILRTAVGLHVGSCEDNFASNQVQDSAFIILSVHR